MASRYSVLVGAMALVGATSVAFASDDQAGPYPVVLASIEAAAEPDTTGAAIWGHIQDENYRENWDLWPGMDELYEGNQPHGMLLTTYVNDVALVALNHGETIMPAGAIVIKENYMPNRELAAVTVMYKSAGYNGDYNDWFFSKHLPDGTLDQMPNGMAMEGRLPGCQGCHLARKDADYLYTPRPN